jgi:hypothetical protein
MQGTQAGIPACIPCRHKVSRTSWLTSFTFAVVAENRRRQVHEELRAVGQHTSADAVEGLNGKPSGLASGPRNQIRT